MNESGREDNSVVNNVKEQKKETAQITLDPRIAYEQALSVNRVLAERRARAKAAAIEEKIISEHPWRGVLASHTISIVHPLSREKIEMQPFLHDPDENFIETMYRVQVRWGTGEVQVWSFDDLEWWARDHNLSHLHAAVLASAISLDYKIWRTPEKIKAQVVRA